MSTPSLTLGQMLAITGMIAACVLQHFGWITQDQFFVIAGYCGIHTASDAGLRFGRNLGAAAQHNLAAAQIAATPADEGDAAP